MQTTRCARSPGMTLAVMRMLKGRNDVRSHTTPRAPRTQTLHIPYERRTNTKRVGLWAAVGIGICITVGLLTVEPGYAEEKEHEPTCTLKTLKGRYLFGGIATLLPPAAGVTEQSLGSTAGYHIFHGDGTGTDIVTARTNGETVLENFVAPFSYTVNPDCTGTVTVTNGPSFGLFTAPSGEELIMIVTDPGGIGVLGPSRRVSRK
jgi:hypothetical protein